MKKKDGIDFFVISNIDETYKVYNQNNFLKIQILGKKATKEFYRALNSQYFNFISLFNSLNNVDIVLNVKNGYRMSVEERPNVLIIQPQKALENKENRPKKENYVSSNLFVKPEFSINLIQMKPTAQNAFFSGLDAYTQKNYKLAISQLSKLSDDPNNSFFLNALYILASSYEKLGDYEKAVDTYREILKYSLELDAPSKIMYQIAQIYKKQGDSRYVETLKKIVDEYPYSEYADKAKFELGNIYFDAKKFNQAVLYYTSITKDNPLYEIGMLKAGYIYYLQQNYPQAAYLFYLVNLKEVNIDDNEKYIAAASLVFCHMKDFKSANQFLSYIDKKSIFDFYIAKAECSLLENKPKLAQDTINEAVKSFPANKAVLEEKTKVDLLTKNLTEQELKSLLKQYKYNDKIEPLALWKLANIYYNKKDYLNVVNLYANAINYPSTILDDFKKLATDSLNKYSSKSANDLNEKSMFNALKLAKSLKLNLNSCDLAKGFMFLEQYKYAFESCESTSECYKIIKANADIQKGNLKEAMSSLNSIKDKDYLNMIFARLSYINGDLNKSKSFFEQCLKSKSELLREYAQLQIAKINIEQNTQAKPIDNKNFKGPFFIESQFLNGLYYFNKKDYENALKNFKQVENYRKYNEQALFYETMCYINMGQNSQAKKTLSILELNYPDSSLAKKLKILLQ